MRRLANSIKKSGFSGKGVLVKGVGENGPAAKGGVQAGDVISAINGKPVESVGQLRNQIARTAPGTEITLAIFRDGKTSDLKFPVGTQPETLAVADAGGSSGVDSPAVLKDLGATVVGVNDDAAKKYHIATGKGGVVITDVDQNGLASQAGLNPGDVIKQVNGKNVDSPEAAKKAMSKVKFSEGVRMTVRGGAAAWISWCISRSKPAGQ